MCNAVLRKKLSAHDLGFMDQRSLSAIEVKMTAVKLLSEFGHHCGAIFLCFTYPKKIIFKISAIRT
jgi:hypothetical protein